jgi:hypothetical protein
MANTPISGLPEDPNITGVEEIVTADSGTNYKITLNSLVTWLGGFFASLSSILTIRTFKPERTTAFTPDVGSDRAWYECNFATDQDVTIETDTITEIGEVLYLEQTGPGIITVVGSGVTVQPNGLGVNNSINIGDVVSIVKKSSLIYKQL